MRAATAGAAIISALLVAGHAQAQEEDAEGFYGSAGVAATSDAAEIDGAGNGSAVLRGGVRATRRIGIEIEASGGFQDDNADGQNLELKHHYAGYILGFAPISKALDLFGRLGFGSSKYKHGGDADRHQRSRESVNVGVGVLYFFDPVSGVRAEYTRYEFQGSDGAADSVSVSYVRI